MPYQLTVEPRQGYLRIYVTGDDSVATALAYLAEVVQKCLEHKCPNVLIIENLSGPGLSILEVFKVVTGISRLTWSAVKIVSFSDVNPEHDFKSMTFAETAARNRGIFVRVFPAESEAEAWIEEQVARLSKNAPEA